MRTLAEFRVSRRIGISGRAAGIAPVAAVPIVPDPVAVPIAEIVLHAVIAPHGETGLRTSPPVRPRVRFRWGMPPGLWHREREPSRPARPGHLALRVHREPIVPEIQKQKALKKDQELRAVPVGRASSVWC